MRERPCGETPARAPSEPDGAPVRALTRADGRVFVARLVRQGDRFGTRGEIVHPEYPPAAPCGPDGTALPLMEFFDPAVEGAEKFDRFCGARYGLHTGVRYYADTVVEAARGCDERLDIGTACWRSGWPADEEWHLDRSALEQAEEFAADHLAV